MQLYLKLFFALGIPFGLLIAIFDGINEGLAVGLRSGIISGLVFGFFMSLIFGTFQKLSTNAMKTIGDKVVEPKQTKKKSIHGTYEEIFNKCLVSLNKINAKVKPYDKTDGVIYASTPLSWKSWGEDIEVLIIKESDHRVMVSITSSPRLKTTMIDFGKGWTNVITFFDNLKS
jgi:hypothetical protein